MQVEVIKTKPDVSLVQYWEGSCPRQVWVPSSKVLDGNVGKETIRRGVARGIPWAQFLPNQVDTQEFERILKQNGIWTWRDLILNRNMLRGVLNRVLQIQEASFLENVKKYLV